MKRLIIPFVAAFGLSLGGATGFVMMKAPKAPVAAAAAVNASASGAAAKEGGGAPVRDSSGTPDSAQVAMGSAGERKPGPAIADTTGKTGASAATPGSAAAANVKLAATGTAPRKPGPPPARPISDSLIGRRLAQVFAAMQPKDAARVLQQMNDDDVRAILGSLSTKQQAAILGSFPTQRAALIVQTTLRNSARGGTE